MSTKEVSFTNSALKEKLSFIKAGLKDKAMDDNDDIKRKITSIESKYVLLPPDTIIDPKVMEEVDEILTLITPKEAVIVTWEIDFLKESIIKNVQSLCQLPVPIPSNFDKASYNTFLTSTSKEILNRIGNANKADLLEIIRTLETQKIAFMNDNTKNKLISAIDTLKCLLASNDLDPADNVIIDLAITRIKKLDISEQAVDFIIDSFASYLPPKGKENKRGTLDVLELTHKDMNILYEVFNEKKATLFMTIANILGLSSNDANILYENMILHEKQKENSKALEGKLSIPAKYKHLII